MPAAAHARAARFAATRRHVGSAKLRHVLRPFVLMSLPSTPEMLLERIARARDRAAFEQLFAQFAPRLKAFLLRGGAGAQQAEDLAQEAMLSVWRKAAQFDPARASAATWIFTIVRNLRIDAIRRERHPGFYPADPVLLPPETTPPDTGMAALQDAQRVQSALQTLPAEQAEVIALFFYSDKPHSEIAVALDIPLGTVKSRLRLAMVRLRAVLGGGA